ncbi:SIR2-like domain-containing protein [Geodermatophilus africanus]|uniref:SIR2-like domain-containing protein n=1 Tax=Geodermatophilus africanus TaxID=1137993 RepID=A0A1H3LEA2_9ACTN|nr:SIR2 family protein [Geodermatophilus africanus]SDY62762.1 SIR2-like domain-containing protein [Geodermatophilus africanus]
MNALDPLVMLAAGMHAQPGVYALLLGSGVSTGAGMPTGWGVVSDLVRRAAAAAAPDDPDAAARAAADPEAWWAEHGDGQPLGYSNLLAALAPTQAARRDLLAGFFEPSEDDAEQGLKVPGRAHRAIAEMVKRGLVRVILTTNFDRLVERALEDAGVPPQVVSRPEAVAGMTPLPHARTTVVKLHGDYADLQSRNTVEELSEYPREWQTLLARVADEYGLVVSGWSADWDVALVRALEEAPSRRYPLYWDSRSSKGEAARRLVAQHGGKVVAAESADDLFGRLTASVHALDRLTDPPLTTAMAVTRLKRYLPDPVRRIDLYDLVMDHVGRVAERAAAQDLSIPGLGHPRMQEMVEDRRTDTEPLIRLLITGVAHDRRGEHADLWVAALQRLIQARTTPTTAVMNHLDAARHYPALLALRAMGVIAVHTGNDALLLRLFTEPQYRDRLGSNTSVPAVHALHEWKVVQSEIINGFPRWEGRRWLYPMSHLIREDLREPLRVWFPDDDDYQRIFDAYEYRSALAIQVTRNAPGAAKVPDGEYVYEGRWTDTGLMAERDFLAALDRADDDWPWWPLLGDRDGYQLVLDNLRQVLLQLQRYG